MHPANVECLRAARLDGCLLANNHVLDWGRAGLQETLSVLAAAGLATTGAGADEAAAAKPAAFGLGGGRRLLVFAWAFPSSGVPGDWAATPARPGVAWLPDLSRRSLRRAIDVIASRRQGGDLVVASLHWGGNWGYDVGRAARGFAHGLIDDGGVAVVHGHSSHHPKAAEVHRGRLILYGAGDLINDYEGISGHEAFRDDLVALYFVDVESDTGRLAGLELVPFQLRRLQLRRAAPDDARWLHARLESEYRRFGLRLMAGEDEAAAFRLAALPRS
jgi:poly-gamma-glutamate synthesis protein (capsule biosynthesis protein)